jgi:hypothetical protein
MMESTDSERVREAAPDLLAACIALRECLWRWVDEAPMDEQRADDHAALTEAAAAIMKAGVRL